MSKKAKPLSAVAFVGKTRLNLYFPENLSKARKAIVLFYGLPRHYPLDYSNPVVKNFLSKNFVVLCPEYEGTFGSGGKFSCAGSLRSAMAAISLAKKGVCSDAWSGKKIKWKINEVVLAGASFGGAVALVAGAKSSFVKTMVSLAPVTHFGEHSRRGREGFDSLKRQIVNAFPRLWKIDEARWKEMECGQVDLNAVEYASELAGKNVLLIHGAEDDVVSVRRSRELLELLNKLGGKGKRKLVELQKAGHVGIGVLGSAKLFARVKKFLDL